MARRYEYLIQVHGILSTERLSAPVRLWTGESDLTILEHVWTPTNVVESVSISGGQLANTETRVTLVLLATTDALRSAFLADPGPTRVTLRQVTSTDEGMTWSLVPRAFTGRATSPELRGDRYQIDLVDRLGDPLRPAPIFWSDEDQQRRYPGDKGLQHMKQIAAGVNVQWP